MPKIQEKCENFYSHEESNLQLEQGRISINSNTSRVDEKRATALVSMTKNDKTRLTKIAKSHGLSLSAFFRLAADEYIANHKW